MNRIIAAALVIALCVMLAAVPAGAENKSSGTDKLAAFWQSEAYGGMSNGDAVYDHEWLEDVYYWSFTEPPKYDGTWNTVLVEPYVTYENGFMLKFTHDYWWGAEFVDEDGNVIAVDGIDTIKPDLYGPLDLSYTELAALSSPEYGQTHITSVDIDGCSQLFSARFSGQRHLKSFSALGCPALLRVSVTDTTAREISFSPSTFAEPLIIRAFGRGSVGADYNGNGAPDTAVLFAYPAAGAFLGWYENGVIAGTGGIYLRTGGGTVVACFGGDVNGDGGITAADALVILREALGLCGGTDPNMADVDCDGAVGTADALCVLRFAMGVG